MVEDDTFTYHVKQQSADQINKAAQSLITKERTQKLDLLIHLLANLRQGLVVCGPEGIGKTTLLNILLDRKAESWRYCAIEGHAGLSFEAIQQQLFKAQSGKLVQQVVVIIDNAGELVPGLISTVIQYAAANPVLRVIFALTHDELQVKRGSDRVIDDCHIVEIPPLSERQCGDFLQHLSTKPYANLSFKTIDDNMIAHVYRETHGVPGRIIAEISGFSSGVKQGGKLKWVIILAVAAAVVITLGIQRLLSPTIVPGVALPPASMQSSTDNEKRVATPAAVEQKAGNTGAVPAQPESQIMLALPPVQPAIRQQPVSANEGDKAKDVLVPPAEVNVNRNGQQPVVPAAKPDTTNQSVDKQANDALRSEATLPATPKVSVVDTLPADMAPRSGGNAARLPGAVASMQPTHAMPPGAEQEKPKQVESSKTVNDVKPSATQNLEVKVQAEPVNTVAAEQKPDNKQTDVTKQKMAERLWALQEKLKQAELKKTVNSVESVDPNKLETIQIPQKPVEIAAVPDQGIIETTPIPVPGQQAMETAAPKKLEPEVSLIPSADNFTLQLMVLSKKSSADEMLKKYPAMGPDIRVIRTIVKGKEKFILEYGSYPDATSANKAKESLPFEFHRAMVRKIAR